MTSSAPENSQSSRARTCERGECICSPDIPRSSSSLCRLQLRPHHTTPFRCYAMILLPAVTPAARLHCSPFPWSQCQEVLLPMANRASHAPTERTDVPLWQAFWFYLHNALSTCPPDARQRGKTTAAPGSCRSRIQTVCYLGHQVLVRWTNAIRDCGDAAGIWLTSPPRADPP